jgi:hypothetical protein
MVAKAGNLPVPHIRSWAGRGISQPLRMELLVWLGGGFTQEGFLFQGDRTSCGALPRREPTLLAVVPCGLRQSGV